MAKQQMTTRDRSYFYSRVANEMLNNIGKLLFYSGFYWRIHHWQYLTHEVLDRTEAELARLIDKKEYRK